MHELCITCAYQLEGRIWFILRSFDIIFRYIDLNIYVNCYSVWTCKNMLNLYIFWNILYMISILLFTPHSRKTLGFDQLSKLLWKLTLPWFGFKTPTPFTKPKNWNMSLFSKNIFQNFKILQYIIILKYIFKISFINTKNFVRYQ